MIINGLPGDSIKVNDRGLMYGDGVFRTLLIRQGKPLLWQQHYNKLQSDCQALGIMCPSILLLTEDLALLSQSQPDAVAKIIITRGAAMRGYAPAANPQLTRIVSATPIPEYPATHATQGIKVHLCKLRLGHQPRLAGIKHLNRLENVLAAGEWSDPDIAEGLLLDEDEHIIEGTRSNLFLVRNGMLFTPDLSKCGVAGVQRDRIIAHAREQGIVCKVTELQLDDLLAADEVFVVNSVMGLWPVRELHRFSNKHFPLTLKIQEWLGYESY
jgi:4-amino-4-deoxychorismate lyase